VVQADNFIWSNTYSSGDALTGRSELREWPAYGCKRCRVQLPSSCRV
jgi:hypothetical protein